MCPYQIFEFPTGGQLSGTFANYAEAIEKAHDIAASNKIKIEVCEQVLGKCGSVQMLLDGNVVYPDGIVCEMPRFKIRKLDSPVTSMIRARDRRGAVEAIAKSGECRKSKKNKVRRYRVGDEEKFDVFEVQEESNCKTELLTVTGPRITI